MHIFTALIVGLIFGIGLIVSGMTDPAKVQGFLDVTGHWDPSLAFVLGAAVVIGVFAFRIAEARSKTWLGEPVQLPTSTNVDRRLVVGGMIFGVGWGLAGYCPGPAMASLLSGNREPLVFAIAMLVGMAIFEGFERFARARKKPEPAP